MQHLTKHAITIVVVANGTFVLPSYNFQKDSNARYMRNKSWPQFEDWKEIFGVDRADGARGVDVASSADTLYGQKGVSPDDVGTSNGMTLHELFPNEVLPDGVLPEMVDESQSFTDCGAAMPGAGAGNGSGAGAGNGSGASGGAGKAPVAGRASGSGSGAGKVPKNVGKKRKLEDKMDGVLTLMGQIHTDTNERLKEISARIGYEFDLSTKRTEVFEQMKGIPGLTLKQQFYVAKKLVKEPELLDLFRGLHETARAAFIFDLLDTDGML